MNRIRTLFKDDLPASNINVKIYRCVFDRIKKILRSSNIEEGGKLLGNIVANGNNIDIVIESYIDSGPNVDSSSSHLHPDGYYQEALFRVIERFDASIEHIGSWHSHHCNGLDKLSSGDINGYFNSVNNPNYNLDLFFSLLITSCSVAEMQYKSFLFMRNWNEFFEIPHEAIKLVPGRYQYDDVLISAEKIAMESRGHSNISPQHHRYDTYNKKQQSTRNTSLYHPTANNRNTTPSQHQVETTTIENTLRTEDNNWFKENCSFVVTKKDKNEGNLYWEWKIFFKNRRLIFKYIHPKEFANLTIDHALIEASTDGSILFKKKIPLDSSRHSAITACIEKGKKIVLQGIEGQ